MASQLNLPTTHLISPLQSSYKLSMASSSQSLALPLRSPSHWSTKLKSALRRLLLPAASRAPAPINLEDDSIRPLSANARPEVPCFTTSDVATNDLCDANIPLQENEELRVLQPIFQTYGQRQKFCGPIVTLSVTDDNTSVWELVHSPGNGRVLLIDAGGHKRCALIGGILTEVAWYMGWSGIVVNGCIRDVDDINAIDIGVRALASHPVKPKKRAPGETHVSVSVGGAIIHDGEWLYADSDGILISKSPLDIPAAHKYKVDFEARHSIKNKLKLAAR